MRKEEKMWRETAQLVKEDGQIERSIAQYILKLNFDLNRRILR